MRERTYTGESGAPLVFDARRLDAARLPRTDCHLHTSWTDGKGSVQQVHERALVAGLGAILFSEHSRRTSIDWFADFAGEVRALPKTPCRAYVGTECKIEDYDGGIDTCPAIRDECDFVMASVHRFPDGKGGGFPFAEVPPEEAVDFEFRLSWAALENPQVDILGHLFGMSYRRFKVSPPEEKIRALIRRAAEHRVAVEINSYYHPDPRRLLAWCREQGAQVCFGSNAHKLEEVGDIVRTLEAGARHE